MDITQLLGVLYCLAVPTNDSKYKRPIVSIVNAISWTRDAGEVSGRHEMEELGMAVTVST